MRRSFLNLYAALLSRNEKIKFWLVSMKTLTNCENPSSTLFKLLVLKTIGACNDLIFTAFKNFFISWHCPLKWLCYLCLGPRSDKNRIMKKTDRKFVAGDDGSDEQYRDYRHRLRTKRSYITERNIKYRNYLFRNRYRTTLEYVLYEMDDFWLLLSNKSQSNYNYFYAGRVSCGWELTKWLANLTANVKVATVLGSYPASSDTVELEGRQMKQGWINYF